MGGGGGGAGVDSTAQKEVAVPSGFSENKVWVAVLNPAGSQTSFWAMESSHFHIGENVFRLHFSA